MLGEIDTNTDFVLYIHLRDNVANVFREWDLPISSYTATIPSPRLFKYAITLSNTSLCHILTGVISNEDSTDVTLAAQLNKDFLKRRDGDDDKEVSQAVRISSLLLT